MDIYIYTLEYPHRKRCSSRHYKSDNHFQRRQALRESTASRLDKSNQTICTPVQSPPNPPPPYLAASSPTPAIRRAPLDPCQGVSRAARDLQHDHTREGPEEFFLKSAKRGGGYSTISFLALPCYCAAVVTLDHFTTE